LWSSDPADYPKITSELYFGSLIGEGSFAKVFEGFDKKLKKRVAIKVIKKKVYMNKKKEYLMQNEVDILWSTRKVPEIVEVFRVLEDYKRVSIQIFLTKT
jgi:serine/threonine protein kinase